MKQLFVLLGCLLLIIFIIVFRLFRKGKIHNHVSDVSQVQADAGSDLAFGNEAVSSIASVNSTLPSQVSSPVEEIREKYNPNHSKFWNDLVDGVELVEGIRYAGG